MTSIELNKDNVIDLLKRYVDIGYKSTGSISIKDGAVIHRYFRILKNQDELPKESEIKKEDIYKNLFSIINGLNANKGYTLDDAAVIDRLITYVDENILSKENSNTEKIV